MKNWHIEEHYLEVPYYQRQRRIRVYLPDNYSSTTENYPVLYLHDGQNVFYDKESFSGYSWRVIENIEANTNIPKIIVVAIDNANEKRLDEYGPWKTEDKRRFELSDCGGDGKKYAEWLVKTVKPWVDQNYRTLTDFSNSLLAGSSMGGLITSYIGSKYPDVFGHLGIFSLASWFSEKTFLKFINDHPLNNHTKVYVQVGTDEGYETAHLINQTLMSQSYVDVTLRYVNTLLSQGLSNHQIMLKINCGETHTEKSWADHMGEFLAFSFK